MSIQVPEQYVPLMQQAAQASKLPENVIEAQVNDESGFNPAAVSPAGAEGMFQFLPSTYDDVAQQAGVQPGTEFNPNDEEKAYVVYMDQLLQQEGGSVYKALEAYNAGPANLQAGSGYASSIMSAANEPVNTTASGGATTGTQAQTDSALGDVINIFGQTINPLGGLEQAAGGSAISAAEGDVITSSETVIGDVISAGWQQFMGITGISGIKDFMVRGGLILLGIILVIIGLTKLLDVHPVQTTSSTLKSTASKGMKSLIEGALL
jgi:hypothetical protein